MGVKAFDRKQKKVQSKFRIYLGDILLPQVCSTVKVSMLNVSPKFDRSPLLDRKFYCSSEM